MMFLERKKKRNVNFNYNKLKTKRNNAHKKCVFEMFFVFLILEKRNEPTHFWYVTSFKMLPNPSKIYIIRINSMRSKKRYSY